MSLMRVVGIMSGTSLDGVDLVGVEFNADGEYQIICGKTFPYASPWEEKLKGSMKLSAEDLLEVDVAYGDLLATCVKEFLSETGFQPDLLASHGHTVFHQPQRSFTLQIGNGQRLASKTGIRTVSNFREKDVLLGGQGAPLVPLGDALLFSAYDYCLNLGGIANVSFEAGGQRVAYDIGIANMGLNYLMQQKGQAYDYNGETARSGHVSSALLEKLNALPYFKQAYPKSLGKEWFETVFLPVVNKEEVTIEDKLSTLVEHCAIQIGTSISKENARVLVTGGGALNGFLMERIRHLNNALFEIPEKEVVEYKEALIFALLGKLRLEGKINCLKSVTGASRDSSCGQLFEP